MRARQRSVRSAGALAGVLLAATAAMPAVAARDTGGPAGYLSVPGVFDSVASPSAGRAWAVGMAVGDGGLIAAWNGVRWNRVRAAGIPGSAVLVAVAASSPRNAWAVGFDENAGHGNQEPVIARWNGRVWKRVPSPNPGGESILNGVTVLSARDAWAVGFDAASYRPLILHWNGRNWKRAASPGGAGVTLTSVTALSARNAWAAGNGYYNTALILHWNGQAWKRVPYPGLAAFSSITAVSAHDAWAAGNGYTSRGAVTGRLIARWNGRTWKQAAFGGGFLHGITAISARDAWAVGNTSDSASRPVIMHWNGSAWKNVPGPARGDTLTAVAATSARNAWAVGYTSQYTTLILHWNGTTWK